VKPKKIALAHVINGQKTLEKLYNVKLDGATAYKYHKVVTRLLKEVKIFNDVQSKYIQDVGERDEEKNTYYIPNKDIEKVEAYYKYVQSIVNQEIEAPEPLFTEKDLKGLELSMADVENLEQMNLLR
jgi:hypothetical protein